MAVNPLVNLTDAQAGWGTVKYGSFQFNGLRDVVLSRDEVYDEANRHIVASKWSLQIKAYHTFASRAEQDATLLTARQQLGLEGRTLVLANLGIGSMEIRNPFALESPTPGATLYEDLAWGPKPMRLELQPMGVTTLIIWSVAWELCELATAGLLSSAPRFSRFGYTLDWEFDEADVQSRNISGYLQVPQHASASLPSDRTVATEGADLYRNQIRCTVPTGFRRTRRSFRLSADRSRLDFSFSDRQLEAEPPPEHCVRAELDYDLESRPPGFAQWTASLSGSIELPTNTAPIKAAEAFVKFFLDKQAKLRAAAGEKGFVLPVRIRMGRTQGSRRSSFGAEWLVTGCLDDLLAKGGLWEPLTGLDWQKWADSMGTAWSARGSGNLMWNRTNDAIIDVAANPQVPTLGTGGGAGPLPSQAGQELFATEDIPPELSWIQYENKLEANRTHSARHHQKSASYVPTVLAAASPAAAVGVSMAQLVSGERPDRTQYQSTPRDYIRMTGKALRIQHQPAVPTLASISGFPVQEVKVRTEGPVPFACFFGKTVYMVRWTILYRLVYGYLNHIPSEKNPMLCCPTDKET